MRPGFFLLLPILPLLAGCEVSGAVAGGVLAANGALLIGVQHTAPDLVASVLTGRDCSVVNIELHKPWCPPPEAAPPPAPFCTRTLADVQCQAAPATESRPGIVDAPTPTPAQIADRTKPWIAKILGL